MAAGPVRRGRPVPGSEQHRQYRQRRSQISTEGYQRSAESVFLAPVHIRSEVAIAFRLTHRYPNLESTVDLALKHQVPTHNALIVFNLVHIFGEIELDLAQQVPICAGRGSEFLNDLKKQLAFLKDGCSVNSEAYLQCFFVVPVGLVVDNCGFLCGSMVLGCAG